MYRYNEEAFLALLSITSRKSAMRFTVSFIPLTVPRIHGHDDNRSVGGRNTIIVKRALRNHNKQQTWASFSSH